MIDKALEEVSESRIVELASKLVSIPSVTGNEHAIADWIFEFFRTSGLKGVRRIPVEDSGDTIVGWIEGPEDRPSMMMNLHMDTFPVAQGWKTDPFTPHRDGDRLHGLGVHDMKGGGACVLAAAEALAKTGFKPGGRLFFSATSDEEYWSRGAHNLMGAGLLANCKYCLVPEPSPENTLRIANRGRHLFRLKFQGKSRPAPYGGGINAAADAAKVASGLDKIDLGYDKEFDEKGSLAVVGLHSGGAQILIPEVAEMHIDRHILPGQTVEEAADQIREVIDRSGIRSKVEMTWDERPTPAPAPFGVPRDSRLVTTVHKILAEEMRSPIRLILGKSVADTNHFAVTGKIPTLICGPWGGNTCEANEYVTVSSLPGITRTYIRAASALLA
jgi:succinyl-diaminopimelate desuccinylase